MTSHTKIADTSPDIDLLSEYVSSGDMKHLANLYQRYMEMVYGVCLKYLSNKEDAQDAVINIFEELIFKAKKHQIENFKGWLYQVSKNHCLMKLRKSKNYTIQIDGEFVQFADKSHQEDDFQKEQQLQLMEDCIQKLSAHQKTAVELFYLKGKCYKEISEITELETGMVKSHIQNGRRNLRICMENNEKPLS